MSAATDLDMDKVNTFAFKVVGDITSVMMGTLGVIADRLGLASRPLRLDVDELPQLRLPCILHWDLNHFVVLKSVGRGGATIHDPLAGVRRLTLPELSRHFTGVALELTPTKRFEPAAAPPRVARGMSGNPSGPTSSTSSGPSTVSVSGT